MTRKIKQGIVAVDTTNNDNDAVLLSLTCDTEKFSRSGAFGDLFDMIMLNALYFLPLSIGGVLSMDIEKYKDKYPECDFVEDAIEKVSKESGEKIEIDFYHLERISVGRDHMTIVYKVSSDKKSAALAVFGGRGMEINSAYRDFTINKLMPILEQIIITDPLTTRFYYMPNALQDYLYECYKTQLEQKETVEYYDGITNTIKVCPSTDAHAVDRVIEQKLLEFRKEYILEDQPFEKDPITKKTINVIQYLANLGVWLNGDFVRYSIK